MEGVRDYSVSVAAPARRETLVEDYLAHRGAAWVSPKTIRHAYGLPLRAVFLRWWAEHEVTEPTELTSRTLDAKALDP